MNTQNLLNLYANDHAPFNMSASELTEALFDTYFDRHLVGADWSCNAWYITGTNMVITDDDDLDDLGRDTWTILTVTYDDDEEMHCVVEYQGIGSDVLLIAGYEMEKAKNRKGERS